MKLERGMDNRYCVGMCTDRDLGKLLCCFGGGGLH